MTDKVNVAGIDKAVLLQALHANSHALGMGMLHDNGPLTVGRCQEIIDGDVTIAEEQVVGVKRSKRLSFDYLQGRVMKVDLEGDEVDPWGYDRDNGEGALARVVESLRVSV